MNTLILYATKYGATKQIADQLARELGGNVTINNIHDGKPGIEAFDTVIVGGSVYMNKIQHGITSFLKANEKQLIKKRLGLFIGCYTPPETEGYLEQFFSTALLAHAQAKDMLGGLMQYDKMNPVYRKIFMSLKKIDDFNKNFIEPKIETERIRAFAERMQTETMRC
ncbi:flavodoxin domain-containing protein [Acetanaerobacterium elongatum]|uniref:Menaquinone-dependent protoporphyrinogen oxidase n=1 Tax=Acetanaerobacterium elongatum TaxID=258515 RepID=A0A1G9X9Y0_9FIRM|nr:flavodoxin domain-containing protein [Acetanaerobacterium elongatum]SDM93609.1 menaquinone-dependent protoporphyrinogen oxidase [Acetanaerobacterium elongatum]